MAFGSSLNQIVQLGKEVTPGTLVAATRRLQGISITPNREAEYQAFRPAGAKFKTTHIQNREWGSASIEGVLAFNEIQYLLSSVMAKSPAPVQKIVGTTWTSNMVLAVGDYVRPTVDNNHIYIVTASDGSAGTTQPTWPTGNGATVSLDGVTYQEAGADDSGAYEWVFKNAQWSKDDVQTYTVEAGDLFRTRGRRAGYGLVNAFSFESSRAGDVSIGGEMITQRHESPFTLTTAGIVEQQLIPASPQMVNLYIDDLPAQIGNTEVTDSFTLGFELSDRYTPSWTHSRSKKSFNQHVEAEPGMTLNMTIAEDTGVDPLIAASRTGMRKYIMVDILGPEVSPGAFNRFTLKMAVSINDAPSYSDEDGTYAVQLATEAEYDSTLGYAAEIRVVNSSSTLQ